MLAQSGLLSGEWRLYGELDRALLRPGNDRNIE